MIGKALIEITSLKKQVKVRGMIRRERRDAVMMRKSVRGMNSKEIANTGRRFRLSMILVLFVLFVLFVYVNGQD